MTNASLHAPTEKSYKAKSQHKNARKIQTATWHNKNATKNFDYTTSADWLRTVSWSHDRHPAGVVKAIYGIPTFPLTAKAMLSQTFQKL